MRKSVRLFLCGLVLATLLLGPGSGFHASASGPFVEPEVEVIHTFVGENIGDGFGWVAESLGDITGDGVNDLIIPAPFNDENGDLAGKVYVYSGADRTLLNSILGNASELFGYSATTAGDVNNDGVPDYVVSGIGRADVPGRVAVYSGADHSVLLELTGDVGDRFGASVAGAGDANDDGYGDILVGATWASTTYSRAGRVTLFSGRDGAVLWFHDGQGEEHFLGSGLGKVGLLDGDSAPEVVVGAYGAGRAHGGEAYVYSGASGALRYILPPFAHGTADRFGQFFASGADDVNNDHVPDIFIGDYNDKRGGGEGTGRAYIFSGADGSILYVFNAEHKEEGFGPGRGTGDINGDGYGDIIVGAWTNEDGARKGGKAYVFSGRDGALMRTMTDRIRNDYFGVDALAVGDVNGDGRVDFLVTGVNFDGTDLDHSYLIAGN